MEVAEALEVLDFKCSAHIIKLKDVSRKYKTLYALKDPYKLQRTNEDFIQFQRLFDAYHTICKAVEKVNDKTLDLYDKVGGVLCNKDLEEIDDVVEHNSIDDETVELASRKGIMVVVKKYIEDGNNVNKIFPSKESGLDVETCILTNAVNGGHFDILKFVLENGGENNIKFEDIYLRTSLQ